jgi:PhoPQ-activated pathogenicity-related protein
VRFAWFCLAVAFAAPIARADSAPPETPPGGPLEAYLRRPQPSYRWAVTAEDTLQPDVSLVRLELVSQTWRGMEWKHRLNLLVPRPATGERARPGHCVLAITGTGAEGELLPLLATMAQRLGVPVAVLHDVPNQPLFKEETPDGRGLREDALIARTFVEFMRTGDLDAPALLPMTRAAIAAMDALGELSAQRMAAGGWSFGRLDKFITTGASKRGWTTWLTAIAAPERVIAIAPIVYDNLNAAAQLRRHFQVWGHPSPSIHDYTDAGLIESMSSPRGRELMAIVDPYSYRSRLGLPKLALMGTNDTYWPLDAVHLYKGDLPGDFFCHYVPNAGHSAGLSVVDAVAGFFDHVTHRTAPLPQVTLAVTPRRSAQVGVQGLGTRRVGQVAIWATRIEGRDFTKASWEKVVARQEGSGWTADLPARFGEAGQGSVAFIGEVPLTDSADGAFLLHTPVQVWELGPTQN